MEFTITLTGLPAVPVRVDYITQDGTATAGSGDYQPTNGTLSWDIGDNSPRTIQVPVMGDTAFEFDEDLLVLLAKSSWRRPSRRDRGVGTIANNDPLAWSTPTDGVASDLSLQIDDSHLALMRNDEIVIDGNLSVPVPITITGADGIENRLSVGLVGPADLLAAGLSFQGGSRGDVLLVNDDVASEVVHRIDVSDSGVLQVDGSPISYAGVESVSDRWAPAILGLPEVADEGTDLVLVGFVDDPDRERSPAISGPFSRMASHTPRLPPLPRRSRWTTRGNTPLSSRYPPTTEDGARRSVR